MELWTQVLVAASLLAMVIALLAIKRRVDQLLDVIGEPTVWTALDAPEPAPLPAPVTPAPERPTSSLSVDGKPLGDLR